MKKLIAGVSFLALAACGSATDSVTFSVPPGYESKASLGPFMQIWGGKDPRDVLILLALPVTGDLNKAINQSQTKGASFDATQKITICDNQPAIFAKGTGQMTTDSPQSSGTAGAKKTEPSALEVIATQVKGKTYVAMYGRPLKAPVNPAAEKAIKNVCPK
jgi:hypothetical protein